MAARDGAVTVAGQRGRVPYFPFMCVTVCPATEPGVWRICRSACSHRQQPQGQHGGRSAAAAACCGCSACDLGSQV